MPEFADKLELFLRNNKKNIFKNISTYDIKEFTYHIVAKGKIFYEASFKDPGFCLYILNDCKYQSPGLYKYFTS